MSNKIVSWEMDPVTWRYVSVSSRAVDLLGFPLKDWYDEDFWELRLHPDDWQQAVDYYRSATQKEEEDHLLEYRMLAADGSVVWIRDYFSVEVDGAKPKIHRGVLIDITDEKLAEKEKRDSTILFEQAARIANIGHWEWDEVEDRLLLCSPEFARIYGLSVEECYEQLSTLDDDLKWIHPDDRALYARERYNYRHNNMRGATNRKAIDFVYRLITKDGVVRYLHELAEPIFDDADTLARSVGTLQDITEHKHLEMELQESEKRLGIVVENMPLAIHLKDSEGRYELVNTKFCDWFGGTPTSVLGKTFSDINETPNSSAPFIEHDKEILKTASGITWEMTFTTPGGEEKTILANKFPVPGPDGKMTSTGGIDVDITALKQTEARNLRLGRIIEQSINEVFCFNVDTLKFEEVNHGACENLGYTLDELRQMTPVDIKPEFTVETFKERIQTLHDGEINQLAFETTHQRKDGSTYDAYILLQLISEGKEPVYVAITQDITEKNLAVREIRKAHDELERRAMTAEHQLADAIEGLDQGIALFDADERFVVCNAKYKEVVEEISDIMVLGSTIEEIARVSFERGIVSGWDDVDAWVKDRLERFRGNKDPVIHQLRNGRWVMTAEHQTRNDSTLIIRTDVTALKEAELQLEAAKKSAEDASDFKSNFLANMSHELRTPLNAIIGFTDIMQQQSLGPIGNDKYLEYTRDIHHSGLHLLALIDDILDLSAIEAGKLELRKSSFDVAEVIHASVNMISQKASENDLDVSVQIDDDLPLILADQRRLMQVMINLLSNAVKFTPATGRIKVSASGYGKSGGQAGIQIDISDTGLGMDNKDIELAMSKFGRANSRVTREIEGTGLGLPLSNRLVELQGGTFDLSSKAGEGTTVTLRFPIENHSAS